MNLQRAAKGKASSGALQRRGTGGIIPPAKRDEHTLFGLSRKEETTLERSEDGGKEKG